MDHVEVPAGERAALQQTAQQTGERFGGIETEIVGHTRRLDTINGSIATMAGKMSEVATSSAVMASTLSSIERTLDTKLLGLESRVTVVEAWIAEKRGGPDVGRRGKDRSTQWWLAVFAAAVTVLVALLSAAVAITVAVAVLAANGRL